MGTKSLKGVHSLWGGGRGSKGTCRHRRSKEKGKDCSKVIEKERNTICEAASRAYSKKKKGQIVGVERGMGEEKEEESRRTGRRSNASC